MKQKKKKETKDAEGFIEIPFGAFDSETIGWTYTIPEGFTAKVEDGKIIVEKKQNENERIRTRLIALVEAFGQGTYKDEMLAYLERQKAKEKYDRMTPIYENKESFESALDKAWKFYNESGSSTVDGCEDNSMELSFAKGFREGVLYEKQKHGVEIENAYKNTDKIQYEKGFEDGIASVKPAEWSEEDGKEMFIKALERAVEQTKKGYELTDCDKHSWWEDFKAYSGIKPAEWKEEDEGMLNCIIATLCEESHGGREANDKMVTWLENRLKSLRPQSHWKPNEHTLSLVKKVAGGEMLTGVEQMAMGTLYEQLKKL